MSNGGTGSGGGLPAAKASADSTISQAGVGSGVNSVSGRRQARPSTYHYGENSGGRRNLYALYPCARQGQIRLKGVPSSGSGDVQVVNHQR